MMEILDIIRKKRDGLELSNEEIRTFVELAANEKMQDCQIGAMLMAMYLKGLSDRETVDLTTAMIASGTTLRWDDDWVTVDKHSTGGVGDKVSLPLAPALAACGCKVPMVSGRGLEFTGGTLDKLESIPGYRVQLTENEMRTALETAGCFIAGPTTKLAPGDKELYKRRDVTATVDSTPLIVGSILSKKAAEGTKVLVMDIKVGCAAFYKHLEGAEELGRKMIDISEKLGLKTRAVLSNMDYPIGRAIGNSLEIAETIECLKGNGPEDLVELVSVLGGLLLQSAGKSLNLEEGKQAILQVLNNGKALECFQQMCICHCVSIEVAKELCYGDISNVLPFTNKVTLLKAPSSGFITKIEALPVAKVCWKLGAGRSHSDDKIDLAVGVRLLYTEGDEISKDQPWCEVHHQQDKLDASLQEQLEKALVIDSSYTGSKPKSRILKIM